MGTRSNNALIVRKNHTVPAAVREFFDVAVYVQHPDAHLWVWETNLAPLHARHGVRDLEEEVAILGWMLSLPERDYKFVRAVRWIWVSAALGSTIHSRRTRLTHFVQCWSSSNRKRRRSWRWSRKKSRRCTL